MQVSGDTLGRPIFGAKKQTLAEEFFLFDFLIPMIPIRNMQPDAYIACPECDLLHRREPLPPNGMATCRRCGAVLYRGQYKSLDRTLAMSLTGMILFAMSNLNPFLTLHLEGQVQETTLISGVIELYRQDMPILAALVLATGIVFPLVTLAGLTYVLLPLKFNRRPWGMAAIFRIISNLKPWGMTEVFLLGILVSIVKLTNMAQIVPGVALYAFAGLVFVVAATAASLNPDTVWQRLPVKR
ncbi:MAG: paraquat-inducible protein A [Desulfobacteraceae bacterium]|nr:MAG: paraquat-inducible protein A [Desulfobacteraceae bacterium]